MFTSRSFMALQNLNEIYKLNKAIQNRKPFQFIKQSKCQDSSQML
jgi:hypothetical protein